MFSKRQTVVLYVVAALTIAFALTVTLLELKRPAHAMPSYRTLPPFALTNQDGRQFSLDELKGKVWLAAFVYTTCPGPCPLITAHMAHLQQVLPAEVRLVSVSTDPSNDTPVVLKAYAKKFGATDRWNFLTGPRERVYDLINHGFMQAIDAPPGAPIIHSTKIVLVDRTGALRAFYDGATEESDGQIAADVRSLLAE